MILSQVLEQMLCLVQKHREILILTDSHYLQNYNGLKQLPQLSIFGRFLHFCLLSFDSVLFSNFQATKY